MLGARVVYLIIVIMLIVLMVNLFGTLFRPPAGGPKMEDKSPRTMRCVFFRAVETPTRNVLLTIFGCTPGVQYLTVRGIATQSSDLDENWGVWQRGSVPSALSGAKIADGPTSWLRAAPGRPLLYLTWNITSPSRQYTTRLNRRHESSWDSASGISRLQEDIYTIHLNTRTYWKAAPCFHSNGQRF